MSLFPAYSANSPSNKDKDLQILIDNEKMETQETALVPDKKETSTPPTYNQNFVAISDLTQPSSDDVPKDPMQDNKFVILSEFPEPSKLFPAYSDGQTGGSSDKRDATVWLNNESYTVLSELPQSSSSSSSDSENSCHEDLPNAAPTTILLPRSKAKNLQQPKPPSLQPSPPLTPNFDGSEPFYVDKKSERGYSRVETLHRPACPNYHFSSRGLGDLPRRKTKKKDNFKRYFSTKFQKRFAKTNSPATTALDSDQFLETNKLLNQATMADVRNVTAWIDLVNFQDQTPMKGVSKTQLAERKFDILDKALSQNPMSDALYTVYVDIANHVLPSYEVSKVVERLLSKDPTNYILWRGLILATQGSMARCVVPDVLGLYERAMQQNYRKRKCDETMLKLFRSCAFFLKQSGLYEQLFALIKLALELNVNPDRFATVKPSESDQDLLIEFEEVVLSSGLPMNEIWLRVEKLRTNFYFLPCPTGFTCSDPQRMVFNEDVCQFIYPLNGRENSLKLVFIILRLLKVPLVSYGDRFKEREESEWDSIEDILPVFLQRNFTNDSAFDMILWDLVKELNTGPSYFTSQIGHDLYSKAVLEMLVLLTSCFTGVEKMVLSLIWLRFERLLVVMARREGKLTEEGKKRSRGKFKKFLKMEDNRNEINYYVEYAELEYDLGNGEAAVGVLESSYNQGIDSGLSNKDKFHICVALVEIHLAEARLVEAVNVLVCLGTGSSLGEPVADGKKLIALAALRRNLDAITAIEVTVEVMEEEQFHLPDFLINSIKCMVYMETLVKGKSQAIKTISELRGVFKDYLINLRHNFIRESLFELQVVVKGLVIPKESVTLSWRDFEEALGEFPHNLFIIKRLVNCKGLLWYKMKTLAMKSHSFATVIFLVASVRHWYSEAVQEEEAENQNLLAHKYRVRSLLHEVVHKDDRLKKNAILWRLYLRILFELENSLDQCKNALFSALDECPWNKSLYLDGAVFVPQELTQIQDLIIEKQLRIYALPEELEILRKETT